MIILLLVIKWWMLLALKLYETLSIGCPYSQGAEVEKSKCSLSYLFQIIYFGNGAKWKDVIATVLRTWNYSTNKMTKSELGRQTFFTVCELKFVQPIFLNKGDEISQIPTSCRKPSNAVQNSFFSSKCETEWCAVR